MQINGQGRILDHSVNLLLQKNSSSEPFVTHVDKIKLCYECEDEMLNERMLVPEVE